MMVHLYTDRFIMDQILWIIILFCVCRLLIGSIFGLPVHLYILGYCNANSLCLECFLCRYLVFHLLLLEYHLNILRNIRAYDLLSVFFCK